MKKIHHFIIDTDCDCDSFTLTDPALVRQLKVVLKIQPGESIWLGTGNGVLVRSEIVTIEAARVSVIVRERKTVSRPRDVVLYCAMLKRDNFELVVQKATELGVTRIVPILTERTVKQGFNRTRLVSIIKEATEQSERAWIPELSKPDTFEAAVSSVLHTESAFFFHPAGKIKLLGESGMHGPVSLFVGPEGGWTDAEVARAAAARLVVSSLGTAILKAETAAIVAVFVAVNAK